MSIDFISIDNLSKNLAWMAWKDLFTADPSGPSLGFLCGEGANGQRKYHRQGAKDAKRRGEKEAKKNSHFCFFEKAIKSKKINLLANVRRSP